MHDSNLISNESSSIVDEFSTLNINNILVEKDKLDCFEGPSLTRKHDDEFLEWNFLMRCQLKVRGWWLLVTACLLTAMNRVDVVP